MKTLGIDIGGTHISCATVVTKDDTLIAEQVVRHHVDSAGNAETVFKAWAKAIRDTIIPTSLRAIGIAMPGPFDYPRGVSRITGLHKYESIYGMNVKAALRRELNLPQDFPIVMENDANLFALGEAIAGAAKSSKRVIGITLGTGLGSGFVADRKLVHSGPGVPYDACLNPVPYRNATAEDYISSRGLKQAFASQGGNANLDVRQIAEAARGGDQLATRLFEQLGQMIGEVLSPWLYDFNADTLVIGGSISRAYDLFIESLTQSLQAPAKPTQAKLPDTAGIIASAYLAMKETP